MIVLGDRRERLEALCASVENAGRVDHPYSMPYANFDVFYWRGLKWPLQQIWPKVKQWR
jgi:hypothetical protein